MADVGVGISFGVVVRVVVPSGRDDFRGGGVHSSFSILCTGRWRDKIDCTGWPAYFVGTDGGGLPSGESGRARLVMFVFTVLQLK